MSDTLAELAGHCAATDAASSKPNSGIEAQLRSALEAYHPAAARLFSSVDRQITLAFLRDYPTPEAASADRGGPHATLPGTSRLHRTGARRCSGRSAAGGTRRGRERLHGGTQLRGPPALADQLELFNKQLKAFDKRIGTVFARHPDSELFSSFPAAGPVIAANLLAEIGEDRDRFPTSAALLAEAGLAPVTRSSGKVTRVRMRRAGNTGFGTASTGGPTP